MFGLSFTEIGFAVAVVILVAAAVHWIIRPPRRRDTDNDTKQ
jgi:hypothetical protein